MKFTILTLLFSLLLIAGENVLGVPAISAQPAEDTTVVWRGYTKKGVAHVQLFNMPGSTSERSTSERSTLERSAIVVIKEIADNQGPSTITDFPYLAEQIGRSFQLDPTKAFWILHWGSFSFKNAQKSDKEFFLRATFKRTKNQQLSSPQWRLVDREYVEELTDRAYK